jgi:phage portal protein BeeE
MSWLTPVIREIQSEKAATQHKLRWFENSATPNLAISLPKEVTPEQFGDFVDQMDRSHKGAANAGKTLYTAGGADVTVVGANMQQMDFKSVQGASETRIAAAAGVGAILANLSEGMQGSSLNAGNYSAAKRRFVDGTMRPLWRNAAGSLEHIITKPKPRGRERQPDPALDDDRDIAFLREDQKDVAEVQATTAQAMRTLLDSGWKADSVKAWIQAGGDWAVLEHSGLNSVQLVPPSDGTTPPAADAAKPTAPGGQ